MRISSALIVTILSLVLGVSACPAYGADFHFSVDSSLQLPDAVTRGFEFSIEDYPYLYGGGRGQTYLNFPIQLEGFIEGFSFPLNPGDEITSATLTLDLTRLVYVSGLWFSQGSPMDPNTYSMPPEVYNLFPTYERYVVAGAPVCSQGEGCPRIFDLSNLLKVQGNQVVFDGATLSWDYEMEVLVRAGYNWAGDLVAGLSADHPYTLDLNGTYTTTATTPEPATLGLIGTALVSLAAALKLRKRSKQT